MTFADLARYSWIVTCLVQVIWAIRLKQLGLVRRYPALLSFLLFATFVSITGLVAIELYERAASDTERVKYAWFWVVTQPLIWTLEFCIVVEVFNRMLDGYKGFQKLGQLVMNGAFGIVGLLFLGMIFLDASADTWMRFWIVNEASIYVALTTLCLLLVSFVAFFRLPVARNPRVLFAVFGLIFITSASFLVLEAEIGIEVAKVKVTAMPFVAIACLLTGALLFSKAGETVYHPAGLKGPLDKQTEKAITGGLQSFNDILVRVLRS